MLDTLYFVIPCYNEEAVLPKASKRIAEKLKLLIEQKKVADNSRIMFVNDGSKDQTWNIIENLHNQDSIYSGISLSRNRGHQNALLAGMMTAKNYADVIITIDADLQQDIEAVDLFLQKYFRGCDVVYGVRKSRDSDSCFKKVTALGFYKFMNSLGCDIIKNHADYRLMSKRAVEALADYKEVNLFFRGIIPLIGFKSDIVYFDVSPRFAGESKYPFKRMVSFALDGITSLSIKPIRDITVCGAFVFLISIIMLIYFIVSYFSGRLLQDWVIPTISIWAIGGLLLLSLGIIGEYVGKTYMETKARPRYIIERLLNDTGAEKDEK